jgi:TRAP-type C4-dicarboxylate transport system permease small subunit
VVWEGWHLTGRVFDRGEIANAMRIEIAWVYLAVPTGALFLALAALAAMLRLVATPETSASECG